MKPLRRPLLLALLAAVACSEEPRVGVVDVQQAFQRSPLVMVAALELKGDLGSVQRDLKKRGRALAELQQQLEHGNLELDAEQRAQLDARVAQETASLVRLQGQYRVDLAAARQRQGEEMIQRLEEVAREVARERGLTLLVKKDGVLYTNDEAGPAPLDITEQVIRALLQKINPTEIPPPDPNGQGSGQGSG
jgi:Skp family chaperone for outer membrane proteins